MGFALEAVLRQSVIIGGSLAQRPGHGGHTWVFLQYVLGLRRLGWDVLFLDHLPAGVAVGPGGQPVPAGESKDVKYFTEVMTRFGLAGACSLTDADGTVIFGLSRRQVLERVKASALLLNVMGYLSDPDVLAAATGRRVFLDIDPGFGQMWRDLGLADVFRGHDRFVTIGQNVGREGCTVPTCGLDWVTTPQPVVLEHWPAAAPQRGGDFTSIVSWRGPFGPIDYGGKTYGLRVHEFRKFLDLPRLTGQSFELALDIDTADAADMDRLDAAGWRRTDPRRVAGDPWTYQDYIRRSRAEFMVAKNMYVQTRGGWFSDRSICYLASGRPVLAQDTGLGHLYPVGEGLLTFNTLEEAAAGVEEINANYDRHARAARRIAEEYFDSDRVLSALLAKLGVELTDGVT